MLNPNVSQIKAINEKIDLFDKNNSKFDLILSNKKTISILKPKHYQISELSHDLHYYRQIRFGKISQYPRLHFSAPTGNIILNEAKVATSISVRENRKI